MKIKNRTKATIKIMAKFIIVTVKITVKITVTTLSLRTKK